MRPRRPLPVLRRWGQEGQHAHRKGHLGQPEPAPGARFHGGRRRPLGHRIREIGVADLDPLEAPRRPGCRPGRVQCRQQGQESLQVLDEQRGLVELSARVDQALQLSAELEHRGRRGPRGGQVDAAGRDQPGQDAEGDAARQGAAARTHERESGALSQVRAQARQPLVAELFVHAAQVAGQAEGADLLGHVAPGEQAEHISALAVVGSHLAHELVDDAGDARGREPERREGEQREPQQEGRQDQERYHHAHQSEQVMAHRHDGVGHLERAHGRRLLGPLHAIVELGRVEVLEPDGGRDLGHGSGGVALDQLGHEGLLHARVGRDQAADRLEPDQDGKLLDGGQVVVVRRPAQDRGQDVADDQELDAAGGALHELQDRADGELAGRRLADDPEGVEKQPRQAAPAAVDGGVGAVYEEHRRPLTLSPRVAEEGIFLEGGGQPRPYIPSIALARSAIAIATRVSGSSSESLVNDSIRSIR